MRRRVEEDGPGVGGVAEQPPLEAAKILFPRPRPVRVEQLAPATNVPLLECLLGKGDVASLMEDTLEEEKETDQRLTTIAESFVNQAAAEGDDEEEEASSGRGRGRGTTRATTPTRGATTATRRQQAADRKRRSR